MHLKFLLLELILSAIKSPVHFNTTLEKKNFFKQVILIFNFF
jgi:hypothetical protein